MRADRELREFIRTSGQSADDREIDGAKATPTPESATLGSNRSCAWSTRRSKYFERTGRNRENYGLSAPGLRIQARLSETTYMNIGLFGGTFDPIHHGHVALARAAKERFDLGRIYFVPASVPPHKQRQPLALYFHRYAMVALATAGEKAFVPSSLEAPGVVAITRAGSKAGPPEHIISGANYSLDTVRRLKESLKKIDRLFFLIGIDAFAEIAQWHQPEALLRECEFIVASRPGYSLADVANALPEKLRPAPAVSQPFAKQPAKGDLVLSGATVHLLESVEHPASATAIREAVAAKKPLRKFVHTAVEEYIKKEGLYL
jgi:nicotinate-nucleotide adenylyltransferase